MIRRIALATMVLVTLGQTADAETLIVRIEGIHPRTGWLTVSVFDGARTFLKRPVTETSVAVGNATRQTVRLDLPTSHYAVSVVHDVNANGALDTNLLGIPTEPFGFSNNPSTLFGPPDFGDAAVATGPAPVVIRLGSTD